MSVDNPENSENGKEPEESAVDSSESDEERASETDERETGLNGESAGHKKNISDVLGRGPDDDTDARQANGSAAATGRGLARDGPRDSEEESTGPGDEISADVKSSETEQAGGGPSGDSSSPPRGVPGPAVGDMPEESVKRVWDHRHTYLPPGRAEACDELFQLLVAARQGDGDDLGRFEFRDALVATALAHPETLIDLLGLTGEPTADIAIDRLNERATED